MALIEVGIHRSLLAIMDISRRLTANAEVCLMIMLADLRTHYQLHGSWRNLTLSMTFVQVVELLVSINTFFSGIHSQDVNLLYHTTFKHVSISQR